GGRPDNLPQVGAMHPPPHAVEEARVVLGRALDPAEPPLERRELAVQRDLLDALAVQLAQHVAADHRRALEPLRGADPVVDPDQREQPVEIVLEAALTPELLEQLARVVELAR